MITRISFYTKVFVLSLLFSCTCVFAADGVKDPAAADEEEFSSNDETELGRLLNIIDNYTEIATKTRLNVDYVPGIVTVLRGDDLEVRGIKNVWEALKLVPGIDISINTHGAGNVVVRGVGKSLTTGNIKYQLNGISMNSSLWGEAFPLFDMPVSQVERIEIIRGPGSAVHGEFACVGVVNVITREKTNRISGSIGGHDSYNAGAVLHLAYPENELELSLNLSGGNTHGADTVAGPDQLHRMGMAAISNAPGPINEKRDHSSAILGLAFKDFSLTGYYLDSGQGDHFGFIYSLPPHNDRTAFRYRNYGFQAAQELDFTEDISFNFMIGFLQHQVKWGLNFEQPSGFLGIYPDGMMARPFYQESRFEGGIDMSWSGWKNQAIRIAWAFADTNIDEAWQDANYIPSTSVPLPVLTRFTGSETWLDGDNKRTLHNFSFQDEIRFSDSITLTIGARYDHYDDIGSAFSPRAAAVWRIINNHILKFQYGRAFRPPNFNQLYSRNNPFLVGNTDIEPETIDTLELCYIYHTEKTVFRTTLYYAELDNLITGVAGIYANQGKTGLNGFELELEHKIGKNFKLDTNVTYSDTEDKNSDAQISEIANWLANFGILYEPFEDMAISGQYRYVGKINRSPDDIRERLDECHSVDITFNIFNLWIKNMTLRSGIKNLFDADIRNPAPLNTYPEDFPRPGREWWLQLSYDF